MNDTAAIRTWYYFFPSLRRGLAAGPLSLSEDGRRARVEVDLSIKRRAKGGTHEIVDPPLQQMVQLYGPGDVLGFDPRVVVRTDPKPEAAEFEYNYFPAIEFADADFVWRFSPEAADSNTGKLKPWITLVVLVAESAGGEVRKEFDEGVPSAPHLPPRISVDRSALTDLEDAWRWAHVHFTGPMDQSQHAIVKTLEDNPGLALCRLMCARCLHPGTLYAAFVVPVFELGRLAGLGETSENNVSTLKLAWDGAGTSTLGRAATAVDRVDLPYYYAWKFRTSASGDFEYLVRLLETRVLTGLGLRNIDCSNPGFGIQGVNRDESIGPPGNAYLGMEGALRSDDTQYTPWGKDSGQGVEPLQQTLAGLVNLNGTIAEIANTDFIQEISIHAVAGSSRAEISWRTEEPSTCRFEYGLARDYGISVELWKRASQHEMTLDKLLPGREYHFRILARTAEGTVHETPDNRFFIPRVPVVVPSIYGRWHAAVDRVDPNQAGWVHELNLDPRHRAAAGLGAEVVRREQERLMASAWEQIGAVESANDVLRPAQFAREVSKPVHRRIEDMPAGLGLQMMGPVMSRVIVENADGLGHVTAERYVRFESRIPVATFDPAFRRIASAVGPIRARQRLAPEQSGAPGASLLGRLALGDSRLSAQPRAPDGTISLNGITRQLRATLPTPRLEFGSLPVSLRLVSRGIWKSLPVHIGNTGTAGLTVTSIGPAEGCTVQLRLPILERPVTIPPGQSVELTVRYRPGSQASGQGDTIKLAIESNDPALPRRDIRFSGFQGRTWAAMTWVMAATKPDASQDPGLRFSAKRITPDLIRSALSEDPFTGIVGIPNPAESADLASDFIENRLNKVPEGKTEPPARSNEFVASVRDEVWQSLNPERTILARVRSRLRLASDLAGRLEQVEGRDPLDLIMWAPEFSQPMYEPLQAISQQAMLPGIDTIPPNTIGLLEPNQRFIEAYLCGMNHEFAGELLWRGYPTDQRGSYFRQFWDVSEHVPGPGQMIGIARAWLKAPVAGGLRTSKAAAWLDKFLSRQSMNLSRRRTRQPAPDERKASLVRYRQKLGSIEGLGESFQDELLEFLLKLEGLEESLKDILPMVQWDGHALGGNAAVVQDRLVFTIRGELLKRYPTALVYAIESSKLESARSGKIEDPTWPVFRATLPPDIGFFGFPFSRAEAAGYCFVIEERVSEARFGLDLSPTGSSSTNLEEWRWQDFEGVGLGGYLDGKALNGQSSAALASATLQEPVRLFIPANLMVPTK